MKNLTVLVIQLCQPLCHIKVVYFQVSMVWDYSLPTFEINQSENNQTLPRLLNQEGFVTKSITSYPRFDSYTVGHMTLIVIISQNTPFLPMHLMHLE